jgi:hypothetical protein
MARACGGRRVLLFPGVTSLAKAERLSVGHIGPSPTLSALVSRLPQLAQSHPAQLTGILHYVEQQLGKGGDEAPVTSLPPASSARWSPFLRRCAEIERISAGHVRIFDKLMSEVLRKRKFYNEPGRWR